MTGVGAEWMLRKARCEQAGALDLEVGERLVQFGARGHIGFIRSTAAPSKSNHIFKWYMTNIRFVEFGITVGFY